MQTAHHINAVKAIIRQWRNEEKTIAFVPTMGNLHDGHMQLVHHAATIADRVVVSIFINPMQFNDKADFDSYPVTLDEDLAKLTDYDVHLAFIPDTGEIYPQGEADCSRVLVPGLSEILCGENRPGHFEGVTTVVAKLFNIVEPDLAVFGKKDYQQLVIIQHMVQDLCFPLKVIGVETVRELDGLAMSSRNHYLAKHERQYAPSLYRVLGAAGERIKAGERDYSLIEADCLRSLEKAGLRPEYVAVRQAGTLSTAQAQDTEIVILAAVWLGKARLIDNILLSL
ncbi:MAG: pantoate--beta-alanine ligase [Gammaproteobacteria bacterium]